ncbi:MAG: aminoglycoside phosphotransferase family protein [Nitrospinales bacterium]
MRRDSTTKKPLKFPGLPETYWWEQLESIFQQAVTDLKITPLPGDASTRRYFRLTFREKSREKKKLAVILMWLEKPEREKEPDFARLAKFLRGLGVPAPEVFHHDAERGFLFLEDFGDTLFLDLVGPDRSPDDRKAWYRRAVTLLAEMQVRATRQIGPDCPAFHLRFDVDKLMWEFDFMLTHYVEGLQKRSLSPRDLAEIRGAFRPVCETLAAQSLCFTHRDFHSRNLMVQNDQLKILDFQDARMGPCQYDLVSLLKDSYVHVDDDLVREMTELFIQLKENAEGQKMNRQNFFHIFDLMAVQRNLKAVGTFAFQKMHHGTGRYLSYIPDTLGYVRQTLSRHPELALFRDTLAKYIPEVHPLFPDKISNDS